jgi:hypothetical protein
MGASLYRVTAFARNVFSRIANLATASKRFGSWILRRARLPEKSSALTSLQAAGLRNHSSTPACAAGLRHRTPKPAINHDLRASDPEAVFAPRLAHTCRTSFHHQSQPALTAAHLLNNLQVARRLLPTRFRAMKQPQPVCSCPLERRNFVLSAVSRTGEDHE